MTGVLVTGANGFVGSAVATALERRGHIVRRAVRQPRAPALPNTISVDIGPSTEWGPALDGIDTVVHVAGCVHRRAGPAVANEMFRVNAEGTRALTAAARRSGVRTLVFISSIGAAVERSVADIDESTECHPETPYGRSKRAGEIAVAEERGHMRVVVFRPPLVYGKDAPGNFSRLVTALRRRWPIPLGAVDNRRSFIFVGNLADAVAHAVDDVRAEGIYHIADAAPVSTPEFVRRVAAALGVAPHLWSVPQTWLVTAARWCGVGDDVRKLTDSLPIDATRFRRAVDWDPPWDMPRALFESFRK